MNLVKRILTTNKCYLSGRKMTKFTGFMVHSVGCNQPDANVFINAWANNANDVCPHGIVDAVSATQLLPWDYYGWHACSPANNMYIGVETTEPKTITYENGHVVEHDYAASKKHIDAIYKQTVELFAYLCQMFGKDPLASGVIISHAEGAKMGIASNHADPDHLWPKYGYTMDGFRQDVKKAMDGCKPEPTPKPTKSVEEVAREVIWGMWGAGEERKKNLEAAGYNYDEVQNEVNRLLYGNKKAPKYNPKKTNEQLADEVIKGLWGAGDERKNKLTAAGYNYAAVQKIVNDRIFSYRSKKCTKSILAIAMEVIRGDWGAGEDRKRRLTESGYDYNLVQEEVNNILNSF